MSPIVVLSAARTPLGAFQGALSALPAPQLGAIAIRAAVERAGLAPADVTDVAMGTVIAAGQGQAPARQAALSAGLPAAVRCSTINKVCGSGLQAIVHGAHALAAGAAEIFVAGGMESMSQAPYLLPKAREGYRLGHQAVLDSLLIDGLRDPLHNLHMGECAERCAGKFGFTRAQQDAYAIESFRRAQAAQQAGLFAAEIAPVATTGARGVASLVEHDEGPALVQYDKVASLRPAFQADGTITAANASSLNDGAAALVLARADSAARRGRQPLARLVAFGAHAQDPVWFSTAPAPAARHALAAAGWSVTDVDLWEINEAFAVVPLAFQAELGVPAGKMNVRGGAIALGHPIGCSGARIVVTLLAALRERGLKRGLAALCLGGGEALAVAVELL